MSLRPARSLLHLWQVLKLCRIHCGIVCKIKHQSCESPYLQTGATLRTPCISSIWYVFALLCCTALVLLHLQPVYLPASNRNESVANCNVQSLFMLMFMPDCSCNRLSSSTCDGVFSATTHMHFTPVSLAPKMSL